MTLKIQGVSNPTICGNIRESARTATRGNNRAVRTIRREDRSRRSRRSGPSETVRRTSIRMMIQSDPHGDVRRPREIAARRSLDGSGLESNRVLKVA